MSKELAPNTHEVYLVEPTFNWAHGENVTMMPNPDHIDEILELTSSVTRVDPAELTRRGLTVVLRGSPGLHIKWFNEDPTWESLRPDGLLYPADELWKPKPSDVVPIRKRQLSGSPRVVLETVILDEETLTDSRTFGKAFAQQLMNRRTNGSGLSIVGQELTGAFRDLPLTEHSKTVKSVMGEVTRRELQPLIIGRRQKQLES